ncbi:MAG: hypothetical protein ACR2PG_22880, partial [Hyphomicrobiaceae bacterium]
CGASAISIFSSRLFDVTNSNTGASQGLDAKSGVDSFFDRDVFLGVVYAETIDKPHFGIDCDAFDSERRYRSR